ncbi:MAG TPA: DUF3631 domain-containing protein [Methylococcaceae bacterium]|nr:DUF3631 domain-containing protein [Methylococcaceae bacterium]
MSIEADADALLDQEHRNTGEAIVERLAALSPLEYDRCRETEAKSLGVRVATLDKLVHERRHTTAEPERDDSALVQDVRPWHDPVDGAELLAEIQTLLLRHVILPAGAKEALSLWILGTYCYDAFRIWPKLLISSPEKRCGKTTLLEILAALCLRALTASNITAAAIFRCIEAWRPALLIDEGDTFLHDNEELRGVINSGHTRSTAFVVRVHGDDHEPRKFSTWCPMVIAMIKLPPSTILDRSVVVRLRRKLPGESVSKLPLDFDHSCRDIRSKCLRWAEDNKVALKGYSPSLPEHGNDRALDNWTPLFAIAELIGDSWPGTALASFKTLNVMDDDDDGIGPMILRDIRKVFDDKNLIRLHGTELVRHLVDMEDRPWAEWRHGKPLTTTSLSRLLSPFGIRAAQLKLAGVNRNGYDLNQFKDAFLRYLPPDTPSQNSTTLQPYSHAAHSDFQDSTDTPTVEPQKSLNHTAGAACREVELQTVESGEIEKVEIEL